MPSGTNAAAGVLRLRARRQELVLNSAGYKVWQVREESQTLAAAETALVLCDVWDRHWCRGANERLALLLPRMNQVVRAARSRGVLMVHAPSDTMDFYAGTPARQRVLAAPPVEPPPEQPHDQPPLPIDASDVGCDTPPDEPHKAWTSQHPAIEIDQDRDAISDNGAELMNLYAQRGIRNIIIMGVHTNMCVVGRSFAICPMVKRGYKVMLVRDLTDTMYSPARPPYVSHEEGTRLMVEYLEKFWCPTIASADLLA